MTKSSLDYYAILRISPYATHQEIRTRYRTLVKEIGLDALYGDLNIAKRYPDKTLIGVLEQAISEATEEAKKLNEAYGVLSSIGKKAAYDREYFRNKPSIITLSTTNLDFGFLRPGESKTLTFEIANLGGPAGTIKISKENNEPWVKYSSRQKNSSSQFPIEVKVTVTARANLDGKQKTILQVVVGDQIKTVQVSYTGVNTTSDLVVHEQSNKPKTTHQPHTRKKTLLSPETKHEAVKSKTNPIPNSQVLSYKKPLFIGGLLIFGCVGMVFLGTIISLFSQNTSSNQRSVQETTQEKQSLLQNPPIEISIIVKKCQGYDKTSSDPCYGYTNTNTIIPTIRESFPDSEIALVNTRVNGIDVICMPIGSESNSLIVNGEVKKFRCNTERDDILPPNYSNMCFDFDINPMHSSKIITICQDIK